MVMGMTYEQFWDMDCTLVRDYRRADQIARERKNEELWLQGMYIYEALCDVAPVFHAFAKKGTRPRKYPSEPYAFTKEEKAYRDDKHDRLVAEKGKAVLEKLMTKMNSKGVNNSADAN